MYTLKNFSIVDPNGNSVFLGKKLTSSLISFLEESNKQFLFCLSKNGLFESKEGQIILEKLFKLQQQTISKDIQYIVEKK